MRNGILAQNKRFHKEILFAISLIMNIGATRKMLLPHITITPHLNTSWEYINIKLDYPDSEFIAEKEARVFADAGFKVNSYEYHSITLGFYL